MFKVVQDFTAERDIHFLLQDGTRYSGTHYKSVLFANPGESYENICNRFCKLMKTQRTESACLLHIDLVIEL